MTWPDFSEFTLSPATENNSKKMRRNKIAT
jgi:hypothetical protein